MKAAPIIVILLAVACACFYSQHRLAAVRSAGYSDLTPVATIAAEPQVAVRASEALGEVHIPCTIEGSRVYGVSVPRDRMKRATEALRQDALRHNYAIEFH